MRLFLARHAEAEDGHSIPDRARALTRTGVGDARSLGEWLAGREFSPRLIRCSTAHRAMQTADQIQRVLGLDDRSDLEDLYLASARELESFVHQPDLRNAPSLLVAHNPGIAELAFRVTRTRDAAALRRVTSRFPPAACAEIELGDPSARPSIAIDGELVAYWMPDRS